MSDDVIVVGAAGYIGSRLCPILRTMGFNVEEIDAGVYGNVPAYDARDFRDVTIPEDARPVVWLPAIHREPTGFGELDDEGKTKWLETMEDLAFAQPERWFRAGHPIVYTSSMQVMEIMGRSAYGCAKRMFESRWIGQRGIQIVRFGTVWGGFNTPGPVRVETAINCALLGRKLTDNYISYTTHIDRAVTALAHLLVRPFLGTVDNCTDNEDPSTGPEINEIPHTMPRARTVWELSFMMEREFASRRPELKKPRRHFTRALAEFYHLPWPAGTSETFVI